MLVIACALAAVTGVLLTGALSGGHTKANTTTSSRQATSDPALIAGTPAAEFRYLATQNSNRCSSTAAELQSYPPTQHLQGSCCDPMDLSTYEWQLKALHRYALTPAIPRDPYDVPVSLAHRLFRYDNTIHLSTRQQATYNQAIHMSGLGGPCCCHCWRWNAFRGMSKFLITRDGWSASRVALLIDDVEGCGGKGEPPRIPS
jgi:hypothetical protein